VVCGVVLALGVALLPNDTFLDELSEDFLDEDSVLACGVVLLLGVVAVLLGVRAGVVGPLRSDPALFARVGLCGKLPTEDFLSVGRLSREKSLGLSAEVRVEPAILSGRGFRGEVRGLKDT